MKKEQKVNKTEEIMEQLEAAAGDMDALISHFQHPINNPDFAKVMRRVRKNIDRVTALLGEEPIKKSPGRPEPDWMKGIEKNLITG